MPLIIRFTAQKSLIGSSYPEGNFGVNQLLDGSMSLSPLYPNHTMDLHVTTATVLHQSFLRLQPAQAKFTIFRVLTSMLRFSTIHKRPNDAAGMKPWHRIPFSTPFGFNHQKTCIRGRLLGPCFETGQRTPSKSSSRSFGSSR